MEVEITIEVECEGKLNSGTKGGYDKSFGNFLPGDSAELEDFKVYLVKIIKDTKTGATQIKRLEITDYLSDHEHNKLYNEMLEAELEG